MNRASASTDAVEQSDADRLRDFLAGRDVECPVCQYNLRDLTGDRCPECGEQLVLRVNLSEPRLAAPIAGLVGLAAGAGLNGLLLGYAGLVIFFYNRNLGPDEFIIVNAINLAVISAALWIWLAKWRAIRRASVVTRWSLVAACWALSLADLIVFTVTIR